MSEAIKLCSGRHAMKFWGEDQRPEKRLDCNKGYREAWENSSVGQLVKFSRALKILGLAFCEAIGCKKILDFIVK